MRYFLIIFAAFCLPTFGRAEGSIPWNFVHDQIKSQDPKLIAFVDEAFTIAPSGGAMRPTIGEHAGDYLAPYEFDAKLKGSEGDYVYHLTFDVTNEKTHPWSILVQEKWY